jgi:hypothetical protein
VAAAKEAVLSGDPEELKQLLVGSRIWVEVPRHKTPHYTAPAQIHGPYRVLSFRDFLPADPPGPGIRRQKHLVLVYTDPGGLRTLSVGSIRLRDPRKQRA